MRGLSVFADPVPLLRQGWSLRVSTVTQGGHISTEPRINERIRVPEVRLVGPNGEQVGIVAINDALRLAQEADLDLVEVAPMARPPVCKLMDYGKFKYESALKARESRKNQAQTVIKEIKLRPKIDPHDYGTKKGHVERFLKQGDKVKVTIMFRGREQSRPELGFKLLQRLAGDIEELGFVESSPKQDGRNMIMVIGPHKRKTEAVAAAKAERASKSAARGPGPDSEEEPEPWDFEAALLAGAGSHAEDLTDEPDDADEHAEAVAPEPEAARSPQPEAARAEPAARRPQAEAAPRPATPRPAPRPSAPRPAASTQSAAPRPTAPRATPATARPAAPSGSGSAAPRPTAPRGTTSAPRTAGAKPAPPRRAADAPVPAPRPVAADQAAKASGDKGEADS
jgi:translation initiation factor IF-3